MQDKNATDCYLTIIYILKELIKGRPEVTSLAENLHRGV
jgi:Mn-dependent DtxR family transcriptional regulator